MGIFDKFNKKDKNNTDNTEYEEYIDTEDSENKPDKLETTMDKVELSTLSESEFEAYVRNPEIFEDLETDNVDEQTEAQETESENDEQPLDLKKKGFSFGSLLSKVPKVKKNPKVKKGQSKSQPKIKVDEDTENLDESDDYSIDEIPLDDLSLDDLEKLYDENPEHLEEKAAIEDLTGVVSLRGVNKRFERLSEKEDRRKEKEKENKRVARRKLMNGTFAFAIFSGVVFFTYTAFETPINMHVEKSAVMVKSRVMSIFNTDVQEKFKTKVGGVFVKEEPKPLMSEYGKKYPSKVNVDKIPIEDFTITNGNYIAGNHIPAGNYFVEGTIKLYGSDMDLKVESPAQTNTYQNNIVNLSKGTTLSLEGKMYPNAYRSTAFIEPQDLRNGILYEVGRDIEKGNQYYLKGNGSLQEFDINLILTEETPINNTKTITVGKTKFVMFAGIENFEAK